MSGHRHRSGCADRACLGGIVSGPSVCRKLRRCNAAGPTFVSTGAGDDLGCRPQRLRGRGARRRHLLHGRVAGDACGRPQQ
ncbi:hypothetical protein GFS60_05664 [Rhodococcus sp. WAY2]|nr:hypothetical protein GFS60_05664 [Rhodococcus sp. WAY2]